MGGRVFRAELGIAVDIGTATVVVEAFSKHSGKVLASVIEQNSQIKHGYDIHHRLAFASRKISLTDEISGVTILHSDMISQLDGMLNKLLEKSQNVLLKLHEKKNSSSNEKVEIKINISSMVVTGNTIMLTIATGLPCEGFKTYPYSPVSLFGFYTTWGSFRNGSVISSFALPVNEKVQPHLKIKSTIPDNVKVYIPPCIGAFVGADCLCSMFAAGFAESMFAENKTLLPDEVPVISPLLLADLGTNCELTLFVPKNNAGGKPTFDLTCTTVTVGAAFDTSNISCGMSPVDGAIDKVALVRDRFHLHVIGDAHPKGICGAGLVSLIAVLYKNRYIDKSGNILKGKSKTADGIDCIELTPAVRITQQDIKSFQVAKSALRTGIEFLMEKISAYGIKKTPVFSLCGTSLSNFSVNDASLLGIFPSILKKQTLRLGNAAIAGAESLLFSPDAQEKAKKLSKSAGILDLSREAKFQQCFLSSMDFGPIQAEQ